MDVLAETLDGTRHTCQSGAKSSRLGSLAAALGSLNTMSIEVRIITSTPRMHCESGGGLAACLFLVSGLSFGIRFDEIWPLTPLRMHDILSALDAWRRLTVGTVYVGKC